MTDVRDEAALPAAANDRDSDRGSFIWYELMTPDPNGAKAFYDAVVGWDIDAQSAMPGGDMDYRMIKRSDGGFAGGVLGLTRDMETHGARPIWLGYVCVDNVDQALKDIESQGGKTMMPANDIPDVGRIAMISDPQGAPIYIMTPVPPASDPDAKSDVFSVDQPQHVRWNELSTSDPAGALDFYKRQFGWGQEGAMDMGEMGQYQFIQHRGVGIGAVMRKVPQLPSSIWTYYIGVDDIDRAAEAIKAGGGRIMHGLIEIPGGEYSLSGMDPQGAAFGLVGPRKQ